MLSFTVSLVCVTGMFAKEFVTFYNIEAALIPRASLRSAGFSFFSDDTDVGLDFSAHVDKVQVVFERMDHTFNMARARSRLRATINGLRQNSTTTTTVGKREKNTGLSVDAGETEFGRKEASSRRQTQGRKARGSA